MLVYANSYGSHYVNHRDLNNPRKNKKMKKTFKMQLKKNDNDFNGNDFADVAVNDNGKYYYRKFNNLPNFFQNLNANNNSIFQLAKDNNRKISRRNYYNSLAHNNSPYKVRHIELINRLHSKKSKKIKSIIYDPKTSKFEYERKPYVARKPAARKPAARKPTARKPAARKPAARKSVARKPSTKKMRFKKR